VTGIDLTNGTGISEVNRIQEHFRYYKMVISQGLGCVNIMFEGQVDSSNRLNLLYDYVDRLRLVFTNLTNAMARRYFCKACHKAFRSDVSHICYQTGSDCMSSPPCDFSNVRFPAANVTEILKFGRVSLTTSRAHQRENPYVNVNDVTQRVEYS